jgi:hypothetical protein
MAVGTASRRGSDHPYVPSALKWRHGGMNDAVRADMFERRDLFSMAFLMATALVTSSCGSAAKSTGDAALRAPFDGGLHTSCPASVPTPDTQCDHYGPACEYPTPGRPRCPVEATCDPNYFTWSVAAPTATCGMAPVGCPATLTSTPNGTPCTSSGVQPYCDYDEGRCQCVDCYDTYFHTATSTWRCSRWDAVGGGCPLARPLTGSSCSSPGQTCRYQSNPTCVFLGLDVACVDGLWEIADPVPNPLCCPIEAG